MKKILVHGKEDSAFVKRVKEYAESIGAEVVIHDKTSLFSKEVGGVWIDELAELSEEQARRLDK